MELPSDAFTRVREKVCMNDFETHAPSPLKEFWLQLKENKPAVAGLLTIIIIILCAIIGPYLVKYSYSDQNLFQINRIPTFNHLMGTDSLGRDLFTRALYGARISLAVGFGASIIQATLGVLYGGLAGLTGGKTDSYMMRVVDILYGIPFILIIILLMLVLGQGIWNIYLALGITGWLPMARIVRGQVLSLKEEEYILAARTIGLSKWRTLTRHILPNIMGPILVTMALAVPEAIFAEAFLSFVGLGVSAPKASWGVLASDGFIALRAYPYQLFFPAGAISLTLLAFNFFASGLKDVLDPRERNNIGG